jgi:hypothetical protein
MPEQRFDSLDFIMAYENGELGEEEIVDGFQCLIDNGMAWSLQGSYGRMATALIERGYCERAVS